MPIIIRMLAVDFIVKVLIHSHIRSRLSTIARQLRLLAFMAAESDREELEKTARSFDNLRDQLLSVRSLLYISAPPIIAGVLSKLDFWGLYSHVPALLITLALIYICYMSIVCFKIKRDIFLGVASWVPLETPNHVYALEKSAYEELRRRSNTSCLWICCCSE